ncbi:MAG: hypothetical protein QM485_14080 [Flavobacteriaceae bacterium]
MTAKKRQWLWNSLIVLTVIVCLSAFSIHYKNWIKKGPDSIVILSGIYYKKLRFSEINTVLMVDKIPPMERLNGFSALEKEKGVFREFKDSLTDKKVYVYVDNLSHQKIKIVYKDSLKLFINLKDSTKTVQLHEFLTGKIKN